VYSGHNLVVAVGSQDIDRTANNWGNGSSFEEHYILHLHLIHTPPVVAGKEEVNPVSHELDSPGLLQLGLHAIEVE
jgi:hypothetical protein